MKRDLASAYAASLTRVASWAVIAGLVYRHGGPSALAYFSMVRAMITAVSVTGLGLAPALTILLPKFDRVEAASSAECVVASNRVLDYARPPSSEPLLPQERLLGTGFVLLGSAGTVAIAVISVFLLATNDPTSYSPLLEMLRPAAPIALLVGFIRVLGDLAGARPQTDGRLTKDNALQACGEVAWVLFAFLFGKGLKPEEFMFEVLFSLIGTSLLFTIGRISLTRTTCRIWGFDPGYARMLLAAGVTIFIAQISDLLYGPVNQGVVAAFLSTETLATYAPLLHIDAALLLGVGGLATLLLPKTAIAMGQQNHAAVRRYYVNGTLASFALLAAGAAFAWAVAPRLFKVWFGDPLPATVALLPLVMIHTVIGGTAGVGRSILFGMNRAAAYTVASLIGGVANVGLAILLVTHTSLGLRGIIFATILTVVVRCAIWMPWYTLRAIRQESAKLDAGRMRLAAEPALP